MHTPGGPEALRLETVDVAPPGPGEAVVLHRAVGVNFIDTYHRSGLYPLPSLPHGIGTEAAGVVEEVGPDVHAVRPGDRVAYVTSTPGTYADRGRIAADRLVPIPDDVSDETAAACLLKGMTVEYLVRRVRRVNRGEPVLLHAAAGGVGLIACQWLSAVGATVIGTVGSKEKAELARAHGCAHPVVVGEEDFVDRVRAVCGSVPVVYDAVGKDTFARSLECLEPRGLYVGFGNASGKPEPFDMGILAQRGSLFLTRPTLFDYVRSREDLLESASTLFGMVGSGDIRIEVRHRWPLEEARACHEALENRMTSGSCLLIP